MQPDFLEEGRKGEKVEKMAVVKDLWKTSISSRQPRLVVVAN